MLFESYRQLLGRLPDPCPYFFGARIESSDGLWLSVDEQGHPYLLFEADAHNSQPDLKLKSVEVRFGCPCDIQIQDGSALSGIYTLVSLRSGDQDIVRVFLRLLEEAFLSSEADHSAHAIREQILSIADLFSKLDDSIRDVLGLWGELYTIRSCRNVKAAVQAWSVSPQARYDFVTDRFALDVKTTLKSLRQHRFSLEQLRPAADIRVYIASILLVEQSRGETVSELMEQVCAALDDPGERARFFRQCLRKGGADIYASELRLGALPDGASISLFEAQTLPLPAVRVGDPISNIRFDLDLSGLPEVPDVRRERILSFSTKASS